IGGSTTIGTGSGNPSAIGLGLGTATFLIANLDSSATGGSGGDGGGFGSGGFGGSAGSGTTVNGTTGASGADGANGAGGAGGDATGGAAVLLVRGSHVDVGNVTLTADATGGDGGLGSDSGYGTTGTDGVGGDARVGGDGRGIRVAATGRYLLPTQRGTLDAGAIEGSAIAIRGSGSVVGNSETRGGNGVNLVNANGTIGSLDFLVQADNDFGPDADFVSVINGDVMVDSEFSVVTSGRLSLFLDGGDLTADTITWHASDFVPDAAHGTPAASGTFFARLFDIATDDNFITTANLESVGTLTIDAPGLINVGNLWATDLVGASILLTAGESIDARNVVATGAIDALAGGDIHLARVTGTPVRLTSTDGSVTTAGIKSGATINVDADDFITTGNLSAIDDIVLLAGSDIMTGNVTSGETIDFDAGVAIRSGHMKAGDSIKLKAGTSVDVLDLSAGLRPQSDGDGAEYNVQILAGTTIHAGAVEARNSIGLAALGTITTGAIDAGNDFLGLGGANMSFGAITAVNNVYLGNYSMMALGGMLTGNFNPAPILAILPVASGGSITTGTIDATIVRAASGTTINVGTINAPGLVDLSSGAAMQTQDITTGGSLRLTSGGSIGGGDYIANTLVRIVGVGAINVGDITIDHSPPQEGKVIGRDNLPPPVGTPIELFGASIIAGDLLTDGYVGLYTPGTISVGTIGAGGDVIALAGGNASFGAITTPARFILGGYAMFAGLGSGNSFDPSLVFGLTKAKTGGSATFGGASSVGSFQAYVGGAATMQSLTTTSSALVDALGLFTLNGVLNGNSRIISTDIDIGSGGAVNTGTLQLVSRNATQTVVGDGVAGDGYQLSDAEFDRIHTPLSVVADVSYGAAAKMLIGDLTATVSGASLSGYDYLFATINGNSSTSVGSIKVLGDVTFTGRSLTDEVAFQTNLFELDAATGSVNLFGSGTTLGGVLGLYAPKVWVASGDILAKLEVDPRYSGYIAELNAPAAVQRPEGVLRAASIDIDAGSEAIQSLLVQNTGTRAIPAGFVLTDVNIDSSEAPEAAPGSIDLVINGQIISQGITYTGIAVRDGLVAEFGIIPFTSTSTINGCPLTGSCSGAPRINILQPTDFQLVDNGGLGDGLFGNEPDIDDGLNGDDGDLSSPIAPPVPLFDSRPLDPSEDINDPASGAGNPSLYGSSDEDDEDDKRKKAKKAKKGDGK
ncbi:MAG: hypothetical protein ABIU10_06505, partial [Sphingomicrobium sp.]